MQPRKDYRRVPNFNLVAEVPGVILFLRRFSPLRLILLIVLIGEVFFIPSLYLARSSKESAIAAAQQKLTQLEKQLAGPTAEMQEAEELLKRIEALDKQRGTLEEDWQELSTGQADWAKVTAAFFQPVAGVQLRSLKKEDGTRVTATGTASNHAALIEYHRALLASPAIARIISLETTRVESSLSFSMAVEVKMRGRDG